MNSSKKRKSPDDDLGDYQPLPKRVSVPPLKDTQNFFVEPSYGKSATFGGGTSVYAVLTHNAGLADRGSAPHKGHCTAAQALNDARFLGRAWIKGHLLNDNLGGPGFSKNLTPMTDKANAEYESAFEAKVKDYLRIAKGLDKRTVLHWYGIAYEVEVSAGFQYPQGATAAERAVRSYVRAVATWVQVSKTDQTSQVDLGRTPPPNTGLPALPASRDFDPWLH